MERLKTKKTVKTLLRLAGFTFAAIMVTSCYYDKEEYLYPQLPGAPCDTTGITYQGYIAPLLESNCISCHNAASPSGDVILSTYGGLKTVVDKGNFRKSIFHLDGASAMPKNGYKLSSCDLSRIDAWINQGAPQN